MKIKKMKVSEKEPLAKQMFLKNIFYLYAKWHVVKNKYSVKYFLIYLN